MNRATIILLSAGIWGVLTVGCSSNKAVSDESIKTDIQAKLYSDPATKGGNVGVAVQNGVVTLTGGVPSSDVELAAMKVANGTAGVRSVSDQMKVDNALAQNQLPPVAADPANNPPPVNNTSRAPAPRKAAPPSSYPPVNSQPAPPPVTAAPEPAPLATPPVRERPVEQ